MNKYECDSLLLSCLKSTLTIKYYLENRKLWKKTEVEKTEWNTEKKEILNKFCIFSNLNCKINSFSSRTVRIRACLFYVFKFNFSKLGNLAPELRALAECNRTVLQYFVTRANGLPYNRRKWKNNKNNSWDVCLEMRKSHW